MMLIGTMMNRALAGKSVSLIGFSFNKELVTLSDPKTGIKEWMEQGIISMTVDDAGSES